MIRVLVAEDVRILRDALVALLALEDDIDVVASLASGDVVVAQTTEHRPDVAVLDIDLPGTDGLTAAAELRERVPECRVLILTGLGQPGTLRRALSAQVSGFMLKDAQPDELVAAIRQVAAGARVIDPQLALDTLDAPANPLTEREIEVLRCAAAGAEPREIADQLFLSYGTVRNYLASAVTKLGARNRIDAIRIASAAGWMLSPAADAAEPLAAPALPQQGERGRSDQPGDREQHGAQPVGAVPAELVASQPYRPGPLAPSARRAVPSPPSRRAFQQTTHRLRAAPGRDSY